ncbi:MAG: PIN domain-containing protein [Armatimonadetes bacterium]|nr:PIN domain-containing protein [Armatimonadota bacterium]
MRAVLVDAGPLVALLHKGDREHERCVQIAQKIRDPLATVWPVLGEAMYLLGFSWEAQDALWAMLDAGDVLLLPLERTDISRMRQLMWKYRDLPMDLADAALVRVAEREGIRYVFTIDREDFAGYRPDKLGHFRILS